MAFTPEQQAEIDAQVQKIASAQLAQFDYMEKQQELSLALQVSNQEAQAKLQADQHANTMEMQAKQARLSAIQIAQTTLIANRNNQPVDSREIAATDITAYAETIVSYIQG
jgi:hypothetical protein